MQVFCYLCIYDIGTYIYTHWNTTSKQTDIKQAILHNDVL